ncbi:hypothetical protein [Pseudomonas sp. LRF_L74]|uniref:hypothetical protein n=1 Tax=Pseudomonas sp. LRF_L74 TaxID=3369422 RepID=UPI003F605467
MDLQPIPQHRAVSPDHQSLVRTQRTASIDSTAARNQVQIATHLRSMFMSCGLRDDALDRMVETRSTALAAKGKNWEDVKRTLDKGKGLDRTASILAGLVKSLPFGAAGALLTGKPEILTPGGHQVSALAQNFITAAVFVACNSIGAGVLDRSTKDILWMAAQDKDLEESMKRHAQNSEPSALRRGLESSATVQTFSVKNSLGSMLRWGSDRIATNFTNADKAAKVADYIKSGFSSVGSPLAGAAMNYLQQLWNEKHQRVGSEFLLGRTDWESRFDELDKHNVPARMLNTGSRVMHIPLDVVQDFSKSVRSMFTPQGMVSDLLALGGGIIAGELVRARVKESALNAGQSKPEATVIADMAVFPVEAAYFGAWALTAAVTPQAADFANRIIDKMRSRGALEEGDLAEGQNLLESSGGTVGNSDEQSMHDHMQGQSAATS